MSDAEFVVVQRRSRRGAVPSSLRRELGGTDPTPAGNVHTVAGPSTHRRQHARPSPRVGDEAWESRAAAASRHLSALRLDVATPLRQFVAACGPWHPSVLELVCFGLGSLRHGSNSLVQLCMIELLVDAWRDAASAAATAARTRVDVHVSLFDPDFDAADVAVLASRGYTVLTENEAGRRAPAPGVPTLFFLPHCDHELMGKVFAANWACLSRVCIVGNSLSWIRGAPPVTAADQRVELSHQYLLAAARCTVPGTGSASAASRGDTAAAQLGFPAHLCVLGFPAHLCVREYPITVPTRDSEWEAEFRAFDCTSFHVIVENASDSPATAAPAPVDYAAPTPAAVAAPATVSFASIADVASDGNDCRAISAVTEGAHPQPRASDASSSALAALFVLCGTRGDVEPCLRLALSLAVGGSFTGSPSVGSCPPPPSVRVLTHAAHRPWVESILQGAKPLQQSPSHRGTRADQSSAEGGVDGGGVDGGGFDSGAGMDGVFGGISLDWLDGLPARTWRGQTEAASQQALHEDAIVDAVRSLRRVVPPFSSAHETPMCCVFNLFALEAFHACEAFSIPCVAVTPYRMPHDCPTDLMPWLREEWPGVWEALRRNDRKAGGTDAAGTALTAAAALASTPDAAAASVTVLAAPPTTTTTTTTADVLEWQFALFNTNRWGRLRSSLGLPEVPYAYDTAIAAADAVGEGRGAATLEEATGAATQQHPHPMTAVPTLLPPAPATTSPTRLPPLLRLHVQRRAAWRNVTTPLVYGVPRWFDELRQGHGQRVDAHLAVGGDVDAATEAALSTGAGAGAAPPSSVVFTGFWAASPNATATHPLPEALLPADVEAYFGGGRDGPIVLFIFGSMVELGVFGGKGGGDVGDSAELTALLQCCRTACRTVGARGLFLLPPPTATRDRSSATETADFTPESLSACACGPSRVEQRSPHHLDGYSSAPASSPTPSVTAALPPYSSTRDCPHWLVHRGALPLATLLPHCAAIVHHGGSGTVAAALVAGTPQVIIPCIFDQPAMRWQCSSLGVCPPACMRPHSMWELMDALMADGGGGGEGSGWVAAQLREVLSLPSPNQRRAERDGGHQIGEQQELPPQPPSSAVNGAAGTTTVATACAAVAIRLGGRLCLGRGDPASVSLTEHDDVCVGGTGDPGFTVTGSKLAHGFRAACEAIVSHAARVHAAARVT